MSDSQPIERPLECSNCTREVAVKYTEVDDSVIQCLHMCSSCPEYQKLMPSPSKKEHGVSPNLTCGHCATTLSQLQHGESLGCSDCYKTFEAFIVKEIKNRFDLEASSVMHQGHKPGELQEVNPSLKILALNEALTKMLNEENYEQAAWIRDQIQELKNKIRE